MQEMWHNIKPPRFIAVKSNSKNPSFHVALLTKSMDSPAQKTPVKMFYCATYSYMLHTTVKWRNSSGWKNMHHSKGCNLVHAGGLTDWSVPVGWSTYINMGALQILVTVLQMYLSSAWNVSLDCLYSCNVALQQHRSVMYGDYHHYAFGYFTDYTFELWF